MNPFVRRIALLAAVAALFALALPGVASAQYREFSGRIDRIDEQQVLVDNRMGDKVKFVKADGVEVAGEGKTSWEELEQGDWIAVSWKLMDKPRKAYKIKVMPPKEDE